ncbi:MAG: phosphoserine phosphatase SerB [Desulfobacterales bacterium]|nr:MAG: phosphoserine phosphatase SerB [Desulfobacterales bacterium]
MTAEKLLMVSISGPDRPGILAAFTKVLWNYGIEIIDIQQVSLQNRLGLYLLLKQKESAESKDSALKDLLFEASKLNLILNFQLVDSDQVQEISHRRLLVLTHFGDTRSIAEISKVLAEENANVEMISSQTHHGARSFEMIVNIIGVNSVDRLKNRIMTKSRQLNIDLAIQTREAHRKNKRMICFDMDSTLVDMEGIDEMARKAGVHREVARITDKAMRGDFDFEASLRQRVAMLRGLAVDDLMDIRNRMVLSEGADELLTTLKWLGFKLGIVSGGFDIFAEYLKDKFSLDFAYANHLEIKNGALTGKVRGDIVDAAQKARIVNQVSCDMGIPLDQVVAIGDGANDSLMLTQAGLGIAYHAKKGLDRVANVALSKTHFNHIFHLLGITEEDIEEALSCKPL